MEKFKHEIPTIDRKQEAFDYINEHIKFKSDVNGSGSMDRFIRENSYEKWLEKVETSKNKENFINSNKVPSETYFLIRENDNKLIGMINIRLELNEELKQHGGHIGYGIRPTERGRGYNKINLYLGMLRCQELGINKIMLDCSVSNLASNKTIIALGGVLERTEIDPSDNTLTNVYWIDVIDSLKINKEKYYPYI